MKKSRLLGAVCACLMFAGNAQANFIVDTGAGGADTGGTTVAGHQWLAGQFITTDSYTVTSVEGWFGKTNEGTITAAIYTDNGSGVPISELFSSEFTLDNPSFNTAWDGAFGLSWSLAPGTYWLAFEVRAGNTGSGYMPNDANGAPNPLPDYAFFSGPNSQWFAQSSFSAYGMRVNAVPLPAAVWLFGSGLLGLIGMARRKKV